MAYSYTPRALGGAGLLRGGDQMYGGVRSGNQATTTVTPAPRTNEAADPPSRSLGTADGSAQYLINGNWVTMNPAQYQQWKKSPAAQTATAGPPNHQAQVDPNLQFGAPNPDGTRGDLLNPQDAQQRVIPNGTQVNDHRTGHTYIKGGVNDPSYTPVTVQPTPGFDQRNDFINSMLGQTNRAAPQIAAPTVNPLATATGATLGPSQAVQAAQLAAAAQAAGVAAPHAGQASATAIAPASVAADSAFRAQQQDTADYLQRLMNGQDSAAAVQAKMQSDQLLRQQAALAASARPGSAVAAGRIAAQNMGTMGAQLEGNTLAAQLQERASATGLLSQLLGTARGQDLDLSKFNADQSNQNSRLGAQLGTSASIANAGNTTSASIAGSQNATQLNMFNAGQKNDLAKTAAQLQQEASLDTARRADAAAQARAQLEQNSGQFNASQTNAYNQYLAGLQEDASKANAGYSLQGQSQNDALLQGLLGQQLGTMGLQQQGNIAGAQLTAAQQMQIQQLLMQKYGIDTNAALAKDGGGDDVMNGILGGAKVALPFILAALA